MNPLKVAVVCKLMPLYRLGVFQKLSSFQGGLEFTLFGDTKKQGGIEIIDWGYANKPLMVGLRWKRTKNYFYKPELLLWQTGIIWRILFTDYKVFIFEGAVSHYPIWLFAFLARIVNKKVFFWTHGFKGTDKGFKKLIRTLFFKYLADGLLLYGHQQKEYMIFHGFSPKKLFVIYNSLRPEQQFKILENIDTKKIAEEKKSIFKKHNAFTMIFIGRLVVGKGVMDILKACHKLNNGGVIINCILIGDGPEKERLIRYAQEQQIEENVVFTGALYDENEISKYFAMSDLMISPGNVGLNCIHSLAYGVPVITHDNHAYQNPEVESLVDNETGVFFKHNDFEDMVQKIKQLAANSRDKEKLLHKCQAMIKRTYHPETQALCIVDAIEQVLKNDK